MNNKDTFKVRFNGEQRYALGYFVKEDNKVVDISCNDIKVNKDNSPMKAKKKDIKVQTFEYQDEEEKKYQLSLHSMLMRLWRYRTKGLNNDFNYFCTITYDSKKISEVDFHNELLRVFREFKRKYKDFRYIGSFERGSKTDRLHFHAIVNVPVFVPILKKAHNLKDNINYINKCHPLFLDKFGLNDFIPIDRERFDYVHHIRYITKYLLKDDGYCEIHLSRSIKDYEEIDKKEFATFKHFGNAMVQSPIFYRKGFKK